MIKTSLATLSVLTIMIALAVVGCSSSSNDYGSNSNNNNNGSGTTQEFKSADLQPPSYNYAGGSYSHTFNKAGKFQYYCSHHGSPGLHGMSGVITVTTGSGSATTVRVSITGMTLPSLSIHVGDTIIWTNNDSMVHNVTADPT